VRYLRLLVLAVASFTLIGATPSSISAAEIGAQASHSRQVTVMTRNLYVGGDITKPIRAALGQTGTAALLALGHANHDLRATVDQTDFQVRARLLARELAHAKPALVGLQEVALWRSGPLQLTPGQLGVANATTVDYDFLALLLADLRRHGVTYDVASAQPGTDVEAPSFLGDPTTGTATDARDVRLTVSDVVLVRAHAGVQVLGHGGGSFTHRISLDLGGVPLSIVRSYAWADVRAGTSRFRFVTTHLESQSSDLALAQAQELIAALASGPARTVLVCDCNSDPLNSTIRSGDHVPHRAAYQLLTGAGGFVDAWLQQPHPRDGFTSGLSELVNDPTAAGFRHRIDLVLTRTTDGSSVGVTRAWVTGNRTRDRDCATGLWPSDHAGVVVRLRLAAG
jgi:endonuclease/exonuclease/phosphatase family metal-dependent hydrolase